MHRIQKNEIYPSPLKKFVNTNLINITAKITSKTANTAPPAVPPITAVIGAICSDFVETPENFNSNSLTNRYCRSFKTAKDRNLSRVKFYF